MNFAVIASVGRPWRRLVSGWMLAAAGLLAGTASAADGPIRILVGFPAGGTIDVVARMLGERMGQRLGVPVAVENLTGAGGQLAAQALKRAQPDGRTLMVAPDHTMVIVPLTVRNPGFDALTDFAPVGQVATYVGALAVGAGSPVKDLAGYFRQVKAEPASGSVGIASAGSKPQFALAAIARQQQVGLNPVPYRGSIPLVQDLVGGHLPAGVTALGDFTENHLAGRLRVIAITDEKRSPSLPDIPTATEQGYPIQLNFWLGMFAPAGTPQPAMQRLGEALTQALAQPEVRQRMAALAFEAQPGTGAAMQQAIRADMQRWAPLVEATGWVKQ